MITMQIDGLDDARRAFSRIAEAAPAAAKTAVRAGAARLGDGMRRRAPRLSGDLEGTVGRSVLMRDDGPLSVRVGPTHGLAATLEYGGEITPSRRSVLAFEVRGQEVFARSVTMPARPFVRSAVDEGRDVALAQVARSAGRLIREAAGG